MLEQMKVKKWGGKNAAELTKSPKNLLKDYDLGIKQAIVVSSIGTPNFNTTEHLIQLGEMLSTDSFDFTTIVNKIEFIMDFHLSIVDEKLYGNTSEIKKLILESFNSLILEIFHWFNSRKNKIKKYPSRENDYTINTRIGDLSLLGFGDELSANIQKKVINDLDISGLEAEMLDLTGITLKLNKKLSESELFLALSQKISQRVLFILNNHKIPVIPGYIPGFEKGIENSIGEGYSNAIAGMVSVGLSNRYSVTLEIQDSVLGILSSDSEIIKKNNKLIESIDYLTAKEITLTKGPEANFLHQQVLRKELQEADVKVHLFDPFSDSKGTVISNNENLEASGVQYISGRKNLTFFSISSGKISSPGVVSEILTIVKKYFPVEVISTSKTEISLTLNSRINKKNLKKMSNEIKKVLDIEDDGYENFVKYEESKALIYCIGQNIYHDKGVLEKAIFILTEGNINIEMVSKGIIERAIVFGVKEKDMRKGIRLLHRGLV